MKGTIKAHAGFDAREDAEDLKKAMKGFGCDSKDVLKIICNRSNAQRQEIRRIYPSIDGKDLVKELISELHGNLEDVIVGLMYRPLEYDAHCLRDALKGFGTKESVLIEILTTRTNAQIAQIKKEYRELFGRDLDLDMAADTSSHFRKFVLALAAGKRDESGKGDAARAAEDAKALYKAGEKICGTNEGVFFQIIATKSPGHLRLIFDEYAKKTGHDLEYAIQSEFSGTLRDSLLACVKVAKSVPGFFAEQLYLAMKGAGTDDSRLIRIVVSRSETDLENIKDAYFSMYKKSLDKAIGDETSGNYEDSLKILVRGNH